MKNSTTALFLAVLALLTAWPAAGQDTIDVVQDLDFAEPEAWAMKLFTSVSLMSSLGPVEKRPAGELALGFEVMGVPHLDAEQRTVGFGGRAAAELFYSALDVTRLGQSRENDPLWDVRLIYRLKVRDPGTTP